MAKTKKQTTRELEKRREAKKLSMRRARERLKSDPIRYAEEKKKDSDRKKKSRCPINELNERDQRTIRKEWKKRSQRYRDRQINIKRDAEYENNFLNSTTPPASPQTVLHDAGPSSRRSTPEERGKKVCRINRARMRKKINNLEILVNTLKKSVNKYKKQVSRAHQSNLINNESPSSKVKNILQGRSLPSPVRKKLLFAEVIEAQVKQSFARERKNKNKRYFLSMLNGEIIKKYKFTTLIGKLTSLKINKSKYKRSIEVRILIAKEKIRKFLEKDENSRLTAGKNETITKQKSKKQKRLLNDSLLNLHRKFVVSHPELKNISYATFCKFRPFWVLSPNFKDRETCLCKQHSNMALIVECLKRYAIINESNINDVLKNLCCGDFPNEICLERSCPLCKDKLPHLNYYDKNELISYQTWAIQKEEVDVKGKKKICSKTVKETRQCSKLELVNIFTTNLNKFMQHVCNINHQYAALDSVKKSLSDTEVLVHMDFSENYILKYASEIQASHFGASKKQISLHTSVVYYSGNVKPVSYCSLSNCLRHDPFAICAHLNPLLQEIKNNVPNLKSIHFLSDGPSTQYRNKSMFYLASSYLQKFLNVENLIWHFSEAGHGKGAPDGVGGCLKRSADSLVGRGKDLSSLEVLVAELKEVCKGINILVIADQSFLEMDKFSLNNIPTFKGTLKAHQIVWRYNHPFTIYVRRLSCLTCYTVCKHYDLGNLKYESDDISEEHSDSKDDTLDVLPPVTAHQRLHYKDIYGSDSDSSEDNIPISHFKNKLFQQYRENMFIVVKLSGKKISRHYVACILSVDTKKEYTVKFMKKIGNKSFEFPQIEEIAIIDEPDIQMVLNTPEYVEKKDEYVFDNNLNSFSNLF